MAIFWPRPTVRSVVLGAGLALLVSGCSVSVGTGSPADGAVDEIEARSVELELGETEAICEEPADEGVGTAFSCTGVSGAGEVDWVATIGEGDGIKVVTTNLVTAESIPRIEEVAVATLEEQVEQPLGLENFDCGEGSIVLGAGNTAVCALTDPGSGSIYDATLTFTDTQAGAFDIVVADEPRS